uniref:Uncharacterized protein n=1 Tax=Arundo donax TaxID=35708 RepID=A0A0A8ZJL3_ARUDO
MIHEHRLPVPFRREMAASHQRRVPGCRRAADQPAPEAEVSLVLHGA